MNYTTAESLFTYDEHAGQLINKVSRSPSALQGDVAGFKNERGYLSVSVQGKRHRVHKIIWVLKTGKSPSGQIDHINGDPSDNRFSNLRISTPSQNSSNRKLDIRNKSGHKGVYWSESKKGWMATVRKGRKFLFQKRCETIEEAASEARKAREFFHGEFARHE